MVRASLSWVPALSQMKVGSPAGDLRHERGRVGAEAPVVGKGPVAFFSAVGSKFNLGEVTVEGPDPLRTQGPLHLIQYGPAGLGPRQLPQGPGVQMSEIHAGDEPIIKPAQFQDLGQVTKLIDLSHGLRA